jgi:hypothetical protein
LRKILKVATLGVSGVVLFAAGTYFEITSGRVKTCGIDEALWCTWGDCKLRVDVTSCDANGSGISVNHDPLKMCNSRRIVWTIADRRNYKFSSSGIEFKDPSADFDGRMPGDYTFIWRNKHTYPATDADPPVEWYYRINILKADGTPCASLDPRVYNE